MKTCFDQWFLIDELLPPDSENIWFVDKTGCLRAGKYSDDMKAVGMSDGYGIKVEDIEKWRLLTSREVVGYPKDGETIAVELKDIDCPAVGMYTFRFDDPITGMRRKAVCLDPIYQFENTEGEVALEWPYVLAWYRAPEIDNLRSLGQSEETLDVCEAEICDDCVEDCAENTVTSNSAIVNARTLHESEEKITIKDVLSDLFELDNLEEGSIERGRYAGWYNLYGSKYYGTRGQYALSCAQEDSRHRMNIEFKPIRPYDDGEYYRAKTFLSASNVANPQDLSFEDLPFVIKGERGARVEEDGRFELLYFDNVEELIDYLEELNQTVKSRIRHN